MKREESLVKCEEGSSESVKREDRDPDEEHLHEDAITDEDKYRGQSNRVFFHG